MQNWKFHSTSVNDNTVKEFPLAGWGKGTKAKEKKNGQKENWDEEVR